MVCRQKVGANQPLDTLLGRLNWAMLPVWRGGSIAVGLQANTCDRQLPATLVHGIGNRLTIGRRERTRSCDSPPTRSKWQSEPLVGVIILTLKRRAQALRAQPSDLRGPRRAT